MKLNIGSNKHSIDGYTNIDIVPYDNVDVVTDACSLPYDNGTVDGIYAGHLLEHLQRPLDFLLECHRVLKEDGLLAIVVPDATHIGDDLNIKIGILFGFWLDDDKRPGSSKKADLHHTLWSMGTLIFAAEQCGFRYANNIDQHDDYRLVTGADWHIGAEFVKAELDPLIVHANALHGQIIGGRYDYKCA